MIGEFLIFDIVIVFIVLVINKVYKVGIFRKPRNIIIIFILGYFILGVISAYGLIRKWWDINESFLVSTCLAPVYLEDTLLYIIFPIAVITLWEYCTKMWGNKK